jgi:endoglucanase
VTSSPVGISCPSMCNANYADGASVTLTATAATGSHFTGWSGACKGTTPTCTFTLARNEKVTATFKLQADLSITKTGPTTATVGVPFSYTLVATNNGPNASSNVVVTDTLPSSLTLDTVNTSQAACSSTSVAPFKVTCQVGTLNAAASATMTVTVTPNLSGTLKNKAGITSSKTYDAVSSNNKSTATTTVEGTSAASATTGAFDQLVSPEPSLETDEAEND